MIDKSLNIRKEQSEADIEEGHIQYNDRKKKDKGQTIIYQNIWSQL